MKSPQPKKPGDILPAWVEEVDPDQLPEIYQELAELIGLESTFKLAAVFDGGSIYLPKLERSLVEFRNQIIREEFDGANVRKLARRWGLSIRHIRHIVRPLPQKLSPAGQAS